MESMYEHDGYGVPRPETGHYWIYTLDSEGNHIESDDNPTMCYYSKERDDITLIGYDLSMEFDHDQYEFASLDQVVFKAGGE